MHTVLVIAGVSLLGGYIGVIAGAVWWAVPLLVMLGIVACMHLHPTSKRDGT